MWHTAQKNEGKGKKKMKPFCVLASPSRQNSPNRINAISALAISDVTYNFGVIKFGFNVLARINAK